MTRANQIQRGVNLQRQQHNHQREECAKQYVGCVSQILLPGSTLVCAAGSSSPCVVPTGVVPKFIPDKFLGAKVFSE